MTHASSSAWSDQSTPKDCTHAGEHMTSNMQDSIETATDARLLSASGVSSANMVHHLLQSISVHARDSSEIYVAFPADSQDPFMQLITEQFGGDAFHFQSSTQSPYCSSHGDPHSDQGASFSYSSTQSSYRSSSAALQRPHGAEQGVFCSLMILSFLPFLSTLKVPRSP